MPLTAVQIDQLYTFTRQHYVEYYDLQTELVDHLANAIETQWRENPKLTFDESLNVEFKKFGVFGFMEVVENRKAALYKKYNGLVWQHFKDFFGFPKLLLTILLTLLVFIIFKITDYKEIILLGFFGVVFSFTIYRLIQSRRQQQKNSKQSEKKWLFEEVINRYGNFSVIMFMPFNMVVQLYSSIPQLFKNDFYSWCLSIILVLSSFFLFVVFKIIPSKTETYLMDTYPEYKLLSV